MTSIIEFYIHEKYRTETVKSLSKHFDKKYIPNIEQGIYDFTEQYCKSNNNYLPMKENIYQDITYNLLFNFKQNNKTIQAIKKNIQINKFNGYNLAFLRADELDEDNWKKILERKETTKEKLNNLPTISWKPCRVCNCNQYSFYQLQTRGADEPMTTFYICEECGKTYKVNN
jgi:DNA-directed RNA polymerase subunit M/transcription elongation factor TFIIS